MPTNKAGGNSAKVGRNETKCKRYAVVSRADRNAERRARRHARRLAKLAKRRLLGKRNAYLAGRKGRPRIRRKKP